MMLRQRSCLPDSVVGSLARMVQMDLRLQWIPMMMRGCRRWVMMDRLIAAVRMRALNSAPGFGNRWAELWERLQPLPERAAGLNLDRGDVLAGALADLKRVQAQEERRG